MWLSQPPPRRPEGRGMAPLLRLSFIIEAQINVLCKHGLVPEFAAEYKKLEQERSQEPAPRGTNG